MMEQIACSQNTVLRCTDDQAVNVNTKIVSALTSCKFFSLAVDESSDNIDTAQLSIFVCCINETFDVIEELLDLRQLITTRDKDIFNKIKSVTENNNLQWNKLDNICMEGAPAVIDKNKG
ncbi:general transcription factor II-I repeat domain-containing protein 2-like [Lycorma delicatula]|uniref:general transcription factor II-I repeat domain-containing protein 2-like n=1 Tax=Lycorma delicatula TaxID=130591 RepID=UPI003F518BF8